MDAIENEKKTIKAQIEKRKAKIENYKEKIKSRGLEIKVLAVKVRERDDQLKNVWNGRLGNSIDRHSQAQLTRLTHLFRMALPRELRDSVYWSLLDSGLHYRTLEDSIGLLFSFPMEEYERDVRNRKILSEYYLVNPSFVGNEVAREVAEMIHSRATVPLLGNTRFKNKAMILHLKDFLRADVFELGMLFFRSWKIFSLRFADVLQACALESIFVVFVCNSTRNFCANIISRTSKPTSRAWLKAIGITATFMLISPSPKPTH